MSKTESADLVTLAGNLKVELNGKKFILIYAYNGTGKTRLSVAFKDLGKKLDAHGETIERDTLYFNAFTEDLFHWDNDLENDQDRVLEMNAASTFFDGLRDFSMDGKIGTLLERYANFNFKIEYERYAPAVPPETSRRVLPPAVVFFRERNKDGAPIPIKVSRGEESLFIWCFFLAIVELAINGEEAYKWVKYLYIDDPISSLDEQNAVAIATHLASILKDDANFLKTIVSTHHPLYFNVLYNEFHRLKGNRYFFLGRSPSTGAYWLADTGDTPFFLHIASLLELHEVARTGQIFTHHFNMLRVIAEKTASFLGYNKFEECFKQGEDDQDGVLHNRLLNLLSHGKYSLYEPREMLSDNKKHFKKMLSDFTERFVFNPKYFPSLSLSEEQPATASTSSASAAEADSETATAPILAEKNT